MTVFGSRLQIELSLEATSYCSPSMVKSNKTLH